MAEPVVIYIVYGRCACEPLRGSGFRRNQPLISAEFGMAERKNGLTYADSGVDIDAGNRLVDLIKPMVRATARAGSDAEIGGFGGLFDLRAAGFKDPVLVAATDGVGTKVKIAIETSLHGGIGIDLVAMSVNDLVVQGAEPLFFLDYFACGKLDPEATASIVAGIAEGCRESGCALIGGETAAVKGLAHITGGGFTDNIPRVLPKHLGVGIDLARLPVLPVFKWLAAQGGIAELELLRTFNCGIGMIAIVKPDAIDAVTRIFTEAGETVAVLGEVIPVAGEHRVVYNGH